MYQYRKQAGGACGAPAERVVGNQQLLRQMRESGVICDVGGGRTPVVQRTVTGIGEKQEQYYGQDVEEGPLVSINGDQYKAGEENEERVTFEDGYRSFESDQKACGYSRIFLFEYEQDGKYIYEKTPLPPSLPVSCIESAAWAMHLMDIEKLEGSEASIIGSDYPGAKVFPDWMYDFDREYLDKIWQGFQALDSSAIEDFTAVSKAYELKHYDYHPTISEFISRKTSVKVVGGGPSSGRIIRNVDSGELDNGMVLAKEYRGSFDVGDGILIASTGDNGSADFHAVAVVAVFPDETMIVLERNAGRTVLGEGDKGDKEWLMNVYENAADFLQTAEQESSCFYKIFKLEVRYA
ncbi:hypothetical protein [Clostridium sp. AN503]|uniref:hypothetical protein n=1 Tax=Clostridium sp. AN503 TaxID=3160598 RepID=UPI003457BCFC